MATILSYCRYPRRLWLNVHTRSTVCTSYIQSRKLKQENWNCNLPVCCSQLHGVPDWRVRRLHGFPFSGLLLKPSSADLRETAQAKIFDPNLRIYSLLEDELRLRYRKNIAIEESYRSAASRITHESRIARRGHAARA